MFRLHAEIHRFGEDFSEKTIIYYWLSSIGGGGRDGKYFGLSSYVKTVTARNRKRI